MWGMIATWRMALEGVEKGCTLLKEHGMSEDALETAIKDVEDCPYYRSVGYGGLPNEEMEVELDAAFMNGTTLSFGAVMAIKDFANPICIAKALSKEAINCVLAGAGAEQFAHKAGFERKNMLSDRAKIQYYNRIKETGLKAVTPYDGHDTVGMIALDEIAHICAGTSTSGLFMKKKGRVGDSAIIGSGLYADDKIGAASATGLGEDLMKGCISYEIVRLMKDGYHPQDACEQAVHHLHETLVKRCGKVGDLSVIAMNKQGEWGCATNIKDFSFVVCQEGSAPCVYLANRKADGKQEITKASQVWMDAYIAERTAKMEINR